MRLAVVSALAAVVVAAAPASAAFTVVDIVQTIPFADVVLTDLATRGGALALTADITAGSERDGTLAWKASGADEWQTHSLYPVAQVLETEVTICQGFAVGVFARIVAGQRDIWSDARDLDSDEYTMRAWTDLGVVARRPDVGCVANTELVIAYFQEIDGGHSVRLKTGHAYGQHTSPQAFGLGQGTPSRDLSVAVTSDRVFVTWFQGDALKLRRFRISSGSAHTLTSLGTSTIATLPGGSTPELGAAGSRVVVAYRQNGDLKVRRSTDKGVTFGSAKTLRDVGAGVTVTPVTVAVQGTRVAIGAVERGGSAERGRGYRSTNGGSSYTQLSSSSAGRIAAIVFDGQYAEAQDESIAQPAPQRLLFRQHVPGIFT
jgi:hypothetical protein